MKRKLFNSIAIITTVAVMGTTITPATSASANAIVVENEFPQQVNQFVDLGGDSLAEMPSVDKMNREQVELFEQIVEEEANKQENPELYKKLLTDFFDESSGHADDIEYASRILAFDSENKNVVQPTSLIPSIGVNFAGSALNVAIGFAVGGGVGAIQAYLAKKGKKEAEKLFTKTVTSKLKAWGFTKLALMSNAAVQFALDYADIGTQIAKYLDRRDSKPNNGWIDF